ncbi:MAG: PIN domain-containing protein [Gordonia polyisoprenivorans]|nr:PIN domain-containing protein [Gordonia polyisoprenivorans]
MVYLLDANALIALTVAEHEHHSRVTAWVSTVDRVALCSVVEGALIRFLVQMGESPAAAIGVLRRMHADERCEFWPDAPSYLDVDMSDVRGHRQVTDAYLAGLAAEHDQSRLATLDRSLADARPDQAVLVPV